MTNLQVVNIYVSFKLLVFLKPKNKWSFSRENFLISFNDNTCADHRLPPPYKFKREQIQNRLVETKK